MSTVKSIPIFQFGAHFSYIQTTITLKLFIVPEFLGALALPAGTNYYAKINLDCSVSDKDIAGFPGDMDVIAESKTEESDADISAPPESLSLESKTTDISQHH